MINLISIITALVLTVLMQSAIAQDVQLDSPRIMLGKSEYSPYLNHGYPDRVYFGDTQLHTLPIWHMPK